MNEFSLQANLHRGLVYIIYVYLHPTPLVPNYPLYVLLTAVLLTQICVCPAWMLDAPRTGKYWAQ